MVINGLIWDEDNIQHIAKHQVAYSEVEEVFAHDYVVTKEERGRYGVYGITHAERHLVVIIEMRDNEFFYVRTAYPMSSRQRTFYRKEVL